VQIFNTLWSGVLLGFFEKQGAERGVFVVNLWWNAW
jgi:hypothetical protein